MEYVEGATIKDELEQGKVFDEKVAVKVILAVAERRRARPTSAGLIHRDIKPENVILCRDGNGESSPDLGLRAADGRREKWAMAEAGMAIGTPYYISPEQVRGQVDVDIRGDIYSLGATLYHMVTGKVPYSGDTPSEVMRQHVDKNVMLVPPDHVNTRLSSGLGMVVETMMSKNRDNRYPSPDDLILDLKCLLQGEPPMIAGQKLDSLASLAEGDLAADSAPVSAVTDAEKTEMAAAVNARNNIIAAVGVLLGISVLTNVLLLLVRSGQALVTRRCGWRISRAKPQPHPSGPPKGRSPSILAEIERPGRLAAERVLDELAVALRAEVEAEALGRLRREVVGAEALVALEQLGDGLHRVVVEVVLADLVRVEPGRDLDLDHVAGLARRVQVLAAEIAREVDHQRLFLAMSSVDWSGRVGESNSGPDTRLRPSVSSTIRVDGNRPR